MSQAQINRRDFLKTGIGVAGAGLVCGSGCAFLAPPEIDKKLVWVCSDIHIGYTEDGLDIMESLRSFKNTFHTGSKVL